MGRLRKHRFLVPAAWSLIAVFFGSQAFACCFANARYGQALVSLFAKAPEPAAHACCPKAAAPGSAESTPESSPSSGQHDCSRTCCIQDAAHSAPQLASAPADLPDLSGPALMPRPIRDIAVKTWEGPAPVSDTGPPVYLRTLRLLV